MNKVFCILLFCILLFDSLSQGGCLRAQDPDAELHSVPAPQAPFVARAPEKSSWIVEIKPTDKGPLSAGSIPDRPQKYLKREIWIKSGSLMKCDCDWADSTKTEDWIADRVKFYEDPQEKKLHILSAQSNAINHDFGTSDFEMLDWIGAEDYVGAFSYAGEPCYLFQAKYIAPEGTETGAPNKTVRQLNAPRTATKVYISVKTKLPVAIINGDGEFSFHFQSPPDNPLVMPEPYLSLWKAFTGRM